MASYSSRVVTTERWEWSVPADGPWGACWTEVYKAVSAATQQLRELGLLSEGREPSDNAIRIHCRDDEVVVSFTVERTGDSVRLA